MTALPLQDVKILPLSEFDSTSADRIFDEQCREWLSKLKWDYAEPSRLLRGVVRRGELTGLLAATAPRVEGASETCNPPPESKPAGFSFYVVEGARASIGDIYVAEPFRGAGVDKLLVLAVLAKLDTLPRLRRIESQSVSFNNQGADEVFMSRGFQRFERRFMMAGLSAAGLLTQQAREISSPSAAMGTIRIRPWPEDDYGSAVRTIFKSYQGEDDSRINSQYGSEEGCAELLSILTDTVWCGQFLPQASRVAACSMTGNQVGVLIASRMSADTSHFGQISVLPAYQGRGIGRRLILSAKSGLLSRGFAAASLAVTATNTRALSLYESCGFHAIHSFPVYFWRRK